ncbi:hypothetical protein F5Y19DRAFT_460233 [Xylariaceae sp. FL1651]|nr:hypothetical protein F5Y19DRAFT_460233 [Xylariaceae sp. FL1651]
MHIYTGKLNWLKEAVNECFTVVFPVGMKKGDPVCGFWRWTVVNTGKKNVNQSYIGHISSVGPEENKVVLFDINHNFYQFEAVLSENDTVLTVTMSNKHGTKADPTVLQEVGLDSGSLAAKTGCTIYTGTLNSSVDSGADKDEEAEVEPVAVASAVEEMFVLIVPASSRFNVPVIATWQWTATSTQGTNVNVVMTNDAIDIGKGGKEIKFLQKDGYAFRGEVVENGKGLVLDTTQAKGPPHPKITKLHLALAYSYG